MKPRIFIGSSVQAMPIAEAIQENLDYEADVTIWTQDIFKLSSNTLDDLLIAVSNHDFAIFVFQPEDISKIKNNTVKTVRDNVIFELGLFIGKIGKNKVFFVIPDNTVKFHLPTDLIGVNPGTYNSERSDGNLKAALGKFCTQVKNAIRGHVKSQVIKTGFFEDFNESFKSLFATSNEISIFVIHARSWRENYHNLITKFLTKKDAKIIVFLPNFLNKKLVNTFTQNFDDGISIEEFIKDAIRFFLLLKENHPKKVDIRLSNFYPTYSFYRFDDSTIIALYPTTSKKKNVPTFEIKGEMGFGEFVIDDYNVLLNQSISLSETHLKNLNS